MSDTPKYVSKYLGRWTDEENYKSLDVLVYSNLIDGADFARHPTKIIANYINHSSKERIQELRDEYA